jgi:hypothetical protein
MGMMEGKRVKGDRLLFLFLIEQKVACPLLTRRTGNEIED